MLSGATKGRILRKVTGKGEQKAKKKKYKMKGQEKKSL